MLNEETEIIGTSGYQIKVAPRPASDLPVAIGIPKNNLIDEGWGEDTSFVNLYRDEAEKLIKVLQRILKSAV